MVHFTVDPEHRPHFTAEHVVAIVQAHGIMLESARGPAPSFASAAAGEPVPGNWWGHARRYHVFDAIAGIRDSELGTAEVLVCRLIDKRITYIHRDLWPAVLRLSDRLDAGRLGWVREVHTESGAHQTETKPFPDWVPAAILREANEMSADEAVERLSACEGGRALLLRASGSSATN